MGGSGSSDESVLRGRPVGGFALTREEVASMIGLQRLAMETA